MNYAEQSLSDLAISIPMSTELFRKNRLDFCCGGRQTLKEACAQKQLNLDLIISEIASLDTGKKNENEWKEKPLDELISFIVKRYHEDLRRRIPELISLSQKVERVHHDHPACPIGLSELLLKFNEEMLMHMLKEENILFPLAISGRGSLALMPVKVMTLDHESHGRELELIHQLTGDFTPPSDSCTTWKALYKGLEKLEEELMDHIHLENHILFPRILTQASA